MTETPIEEYPWDDSMRHRNLTCKNHRGMKYLTKHPTLRTVHIIEVDPSISAQGKIECDCPFADLLVIEEDGE